MIVPARLGLTPDQNVMADLICTDEYLIMLKLILLRSDYTLFSFSANRNLCLRSFKCIQPAHALSTTTVSSTVTIQYSEKLPIGSLRVDHSIIGIANSVCQSHQPRYNLTM
jgi:hypothetical protein